jgi:hypothetical protein
MDGCLLDCCFNSGYEGLKFNCLKFKTVEIREKFCYVFEVNMRKMTLNSRKIADF